MTSNTDIEMRWIEAWGVLRDIADDRADMPCLLPDGAIVSLDECEGWIQTSVYQGYHVRVEAGWAGHRQGAIVHRWQEAGA